jgi:hypothetical protein
LDGGLRRGSAEVAPVALTRAGLIALAAAPVALAAAVAIAPAALASTAIAVALAAAATLAAAAIAAERLAAAAVVMALAAAAVAALAAAAVAIAAVARALPRRVADATVAVTVRRAGRCAEAQCEGKHDGDRSEHDTGDEPARTELEVVGQPRGHGLRPMFSLSARCVTCPQGQRTFVRRFGRPASNGPDRHGSGRPREYVLAGLWPAAAGAACHARLVVV